MKFSHCNPHLPVRNLRETLDYYRDNLGFSDEWMEGQTDGGLRRDNMWLLFQEDPAFNKTINNENHRLPIMWFVENIEDVYAEFQNRGITITDPLQPHSYGLWEFGFVEINGFYVRVAERKA